MKKRILGIDTGTNSLGWAVVEREDNGLYKLIDKGSYIFQEGVKIEKNVESSKAAERTGHRASRRHYFRRRLRKIEALKVLMEYGWCPQLTEEALHDWHVKKQYPKDEAFMAWQRTDDKLDRNPYAYRHICLHEELDLDNEAERYILGRALYHLAQRRGFMSNRLEQTDDDKDKDNDKVKTGIDKLSKSMREAGFEYLGDYFYYLYKEYLYKEKRNEERIRNTYTDREQHYRKEFEAICRRQRLSDVQVRKLERALYFQRPLKSQRQGVGRCTFEPRRQRCAESHPDYEMFRMLSFLNNVKVKGPYDMELRSLTDEERQKAKEKFFRKSKPQFDFEDIAKAIAGRGRYQYIKDDGDKGYSFNYRMTQSVTGCPTIAALKDIFGEDYRDAIAECYAKSEGKTPEQMVNDVWNVLYSFPDEENLRLWAQECLQLNEEDAKKFSKINLPKGFASLSLAAIRRILPWLEQGMIYPHAVLMAKVPDIVGKEIWARRAGEITEMLTAFINDFRMGDKSVQGTLEYCIKDILRNNCDLAAGAADRLYHPSMIEVYPDAKNNRNGVLQLGSPHTNAVRNPMAMRSLHQLRKVVNALLRKGVITSDTEVHIEYARELNDANKRKAIADMNRDRETKRAKYRDEIKKLYKENCKLDIDPTEDDILKFELWREQERTCLYTGEPICICDFIGPNPRYDIEHTIPRSAGGDTTRENLTLCSSRFNRDVKGTKLPSQLFNHDEIMLRLADWKDKIDNLRKQVDKVRTYSGMAKDKKDTLIQKRHKLKMELEYWQEKYKRFTMTEVPEGFARRQGAGIGLVGKYAGLYLKSLFHKSDDRTKSNVRVVKGSITAEFRKMWGIQNEYEKKSRDNHVHHCIDAVTIACIDTGAYNEMAKYYQQLEEYERDRAQKPEFGKPWPTFTEDVKALAKEILVVHNTPDNIAKRMHRKVKTPKGIFMTGGDSVRGSLHKDTFYGAISKDGEIRYVVRKPLESFEKVEDADNIVDDAVRAKVKEAFDKKGFKKAIKEGIYMNEEKGIKINKVRCYANRVTNPLKIRKHRDVSKMEYKQEYYVRNDTNYCLAIYEGLVKGKKKRDYELIKTIDAGRFFKQSTDKHEFSSLIPEKSINGFPLKYKLKVGLHVILYENTPEEIDFNNNVDVCKRLYVVSGLQFDTTGNGYVTVVVKHHQEARRTEELKANRGVYRMNAEYRAKISMRHTQFNALVEGADFILTPLGEVKLLHEIC